MVKNRICLLLFATVLFTGVLFRPVYSKNIALMVGINDYINLTESDGDLQGCVNDVLHMKQLLINKYGFAENDIKTLFDKDATKENILKNFKSWIINRAKAGDVVVFHYSGHGSYLDDDNGDEGDGLDEALCAADCDPYGDKGYIRDDLIGELIDEVQTDKITVILDCCHSGTGTRLSVKNSPKSRCYVPKFMEGKKGTKETSLVNQPGEESRATVITGCSSTQTSADAYWPLSDTDGVWMGALTRNLYEALLFASPGTTSKSLMSKVGQNLKSQGYEQTPQLEGKDKDKPIFNISSNSIQTSIPVSSVKGNSVELEMGGIGGGITVGSIYNIYPSGEKTFKESKQIGKVQIVETGNLISKGKIIEGKVEVKSRAVEVSRNYNTDNAVDIVITDGNLAAGLKPLLENTGYINVVNPGNPFDRLIQKGAGDYDITLFYPDGRKIADISSQTAEDLSLQLKPWLENAYLIENLSKLDNPKPDFSLDVWTDRKENPVYSIGDAVTFNFKSNSDCYITLIDIGTDGTVTILYPNKFFTDNKITAGTPYSIPSGDMKFRIKASGPAGQEMVKAIATKKPIDLVEGLSSTGVFKNVNDPVNYIKNIPQILKGLTVEGTSQSSEQNDVSFNGWSTASVIITVKD